MPDYLAITPLRELTPAGVAVLAKTFPKRSEVTTAPRPAYASIGTHSWSRPFYNRESPEVSRLSGLIAEAQYASRDVNLIFLGDSKTEGTGADAGERPAQSFVGVFQRMIGAKEGFVAANTSANDSRWNATGMIRSTDPTRNGILRDAGATSITVTYTPGFAHKGGSFWIYCAAGGSVSIAVDGGAGQSITIPAGNGYKSIAPTVTGDSAHTYVITSNDDIRIFGHSPVYTGAQLRVSNFGRSGSTAAGWQPGLYADGTGLWDAMRTAEPSPSAVAAQIGTNSPATSAAPIGILWAAIAAMKVPSVVIAPGGLGGAAAVSTYEPIYQAAWDAAEAYDLPLIDFQSAIGEYGKAVLDLLMSDTLHENKRGYAREAAMLKALLT